MIALNKDGKPLKDGGKLKAYLHALLLQMWKTAKQSRHHVYAAQLI